MPRWTLILTIIMPRNDLGMTEMAEINLEMCLMMVSIGSSLELGPEPNHLTTSLARLLDEHGTVFPLHILIMSTARTGKRLDPVHIVLFIEQMRNGVQVIYGDGNKNSIDILP